MFVPDKRKEGNGAKREGRMFQILTVLFDARQSGAIVADQRGALTSTQIAHQLGLAPSWYVRDMLHEMAAQNWIYGFEWQKTNGAFAFVWMIHEDTIHSEKWGAAFAAWYDELPVLLPLGIR